MEISAKNLSGIIENFKDMAPIAYNYYQVLTDERTVKIEHEFTGLGTIELHIQFLLLLLCRALSSLLRP